MESGAVKCDAHSVSSGGDSKFFREQAFDRLISEIAELKAGNDAQFQDSVGFPDRQLRVRREHGPIGCTQGQNIAILQKAAIQTANALPRGGATAIELRCRHDTAR